MKTFRKHLDQKMKKVSFKKIMTNTAKPKIDPSRLRKVEVEPVMKAGQKVTIGEPINFYIPETKPLKVGNFKKRKK